MRALPLVLAGLLAAACGGEGAPPRADIVRATLVADPAPVLDAQLDLLFSRTMLDALEQGVPLELDLALTGRDAGASLTERRTLRLRYLPLARRWQLRDANGVERHYARRTQLIASLDRVRVVLPPEWLPLRDDGEFTLTISFATDKLPGPLRLPALLERDWRFPTATYAWHAAG
jgi:hypothetical protein